MDNLPVAVLPFAQYVPNHETGHLQPNRTQSFTYDSLNRIFTAKTTATSGPDCWAQSFGYDAWGNLLSETPTQSGCTMTMLSVGVNTNNQITASGFSYDVAGNLLTDGVAGNKYTFDAENRIDSVNSGAATYEYDANGNRVRKLVGSDSTEYFYSGGQPIAEYKSATSGWSDYVYAGGRRIAATERKWAQEARQPGEEYMVSLLNEYRAAWALIRQWAGHDAAVAQREEQIKKLERLVWDAVYALQKAGLDGEAARLRRALQRCQLPICLNV